MRIDVNRGAEFLVGFVLFSAMLLPGLVRAHEGDDQSAHHEEELTVKVEEVKELTSDLILPDAIPAQGAPTALEIAKERQEIMLELAEEDPKAFLQNALPPEQRADLPKAVQAVTEQQKTIKGVMEVLHKDDFEDSKNSEFKYKIKVGKKKLDFYPAGAPPALASGDTVEITGYQIGNAVVATGGEGGVEVVYQQLENATGTQKVLFILVDSIDSDDRAERLPSSSEMLDTIQNGAFQKFYKEQSYNKIAFQAETTGWIPVPDLDWGVCLSVGFETSAINKYLKDQKVDLNRYGHVVFVVNGAGGGCAFVGPVTRAFNGRDYHLTQGWVGYPDSGWDKDNMSGFEYVLAHEMGHQLGVMHANAWSCRGPSLDSNCYHSEYGNSFDVMGTGGEAAHFNAFYKDLLGWLGPAEKVRVTKAGNYTLTPLETPGGVKTAIISNPAGPIRPPLYVEYRRPIGFDSVMQDKYTGLFLNQVRDTMGLPYPHLIDAQYAKPGANAREDRTFGPNLTGPTTLQPTPDVFSWPSKGIRIEAQQARPNDMTFSLQMKTPECVRNAPFFDEEDIYYDSFVGVGEIAVLQVEITNIDTDICPPREITLKPSVSPARGEISVYPEGPLQLAAGESEYVTVQFETDKDSTPLGVYELRLDASTKGDSSVRVARNVEVVQPAKIYGISPSVGAVGSRVTLAGAGFYPESIVHFDGDDAYGELEANVGSSTTELSFTVPDELRVFNREEDDWEYGLPPSGQYYITLEKAVDGDGVGVYSNEIIFDIVANGIATEFLDATTELSPNPAVGSFDISFSATALGEDVYIPKSIARATTTTVATPAGVTFTVSSSTGVTTAGIFSGSLISDAALSSGYYVVREGTSEDFLVRVVYTAPVTGAYQVSLNTLNYDTSAKVPTKRRPFEEEFRTDYLTLTKTTPCTTNVLVAGKSLTPGGSLKSCNGAHVLTLGTDGNLSLRLNSGTTSAWTSGTIGSGANILTMQADGNLVLYTKDRKAVWSLLSYQGGRMGTGQYLQLKDDGTLAVYNQKGEVRWNTGMSLKVQKPSVTAILPKGAYTLGGNVPMKWDYANIPDNSQIIAAVERISAPGASTGSHVVTWQSPKISGTGTYTRSPEMTTGGATFTAGTYRVLTKVRQCNSAGCNFNYPSNESLPVLATSSVTEFVLSSVNPTTTPTGTLTVTPCVIGSAPSTLQPTKTDVCDSLITWNTTGATKAYTSIKGSSPYLSGVYPYGYTTPGGTGLSGNNVKFWTPAGTYTVSLYVNGDYSNSKDKANTGTKVAEKTITVLPKNTTSTTTCGKLLPGKTLTPGQTLTSCNGVHTATFTADGNFTFGSWNSNTAGKGATKLTMQTDGNLVIYAGSKPLWSVLSHDGGRMGTGQYLELKDDGTLAVYNEAGSVRWNTSMPFKAVGAISAITPCTVGVGKSTTDPNNAVICDQSISWSSSNATDVKLVITGAFPYDTANFPNGHTAGTGAEGTAAFWVTTGTYKATLYSGSTKLTDKTFTIAPAATAPTTPTATTTQSHKLNQMANVLEAIRSLLKGWR